ncbi:MAG: acyl carrier protein [Deltaproteobacteria bacterium]|nr:acyl carrier protein [Deltaproteobacteria bacterium]MBW2070251.1 acyl carrier protein [Deltaproteobacteria bacterium]
MYSYQDIREQLCEILQPFVKDGRTLTEETDLIDDLGLDSLQVMKLLVQVEDRFDISIPLNILPTVRTVKDFALQLQEIIKEGA